MKVQLIRERIGKYIEQYAQERTVRNLHFWEVHSNFTKVREKGTAYFVNNLDKAFSSEISKRLWKHEDYFPLEILQRFVELDAEFVEFMFRDLFNEQEDSALKVSRFVEYCDDMLAKLQKKDLKVDYHYHSDLRIIFVYLSFAYSDSYTFYDQQLYNRYLQQVGASNVPRIHDVTKFQNLTKATRRILSESDAFTQFVNEQSQNAGTDLSNMSFWVFEFYSQDLP